MDCIHTILEIINEEYDFWVDEETYEEDYDTWEDFFRDRISLVHGLENIEVKRGVHKGVFLLNDKAIKVFIRSNHPLIDNEYINYRDSINAGLSKFFPVTTPPIKYTLTNGAEVWVYKQEQVYGQPLCKNYSLFEECEEGLSIETIEKNMRTWSTINGYEFATIASCFYPSEILDRLYAFCKQRFINDLHSHNFSVDTTADTVHIIDFCGC